MKLSSRLVLIAGLMFSPSGFAGFRVGNGGDYVRATFLRMGEAITQYLTETVDGKAVTNQNNLNIEQLKAALDIEKVSVTDEVLRDNSGSLVDAIGEPGSIKLNKEAWFSHFEKQRDVYSLVFHEMLRASGVNDDNYVISQALTHFPRSLRIETRIVPVLPLIAEDNLARVFDLEKVNAGGTGCSQSADLVSNLARSFKIEFDQEKNILEVIPSLYRNEVTRERIVDIKSCQIAIPITLPAKKRLVISQIDLLGKVDLEQGSQAKLSFEAFLSGSSSPLRTRTISAAADLNGRVLTRRTEILRSKCGGSDLVRMNTNIVTQGSQKRLESFSVRSLSLYLSLEDCR